MADLYTALRNAHNAGDTEAATRIAAMIKNQQGGSNAPTTPQEAPQATQQPTQATTQPTTPEPATEPQSALEQGFNYVGNVAATGGRMIAGGVADLANVGVGALNAIGQGVQSASNAITGETGQYQPIAPAGYGSLDQYLMPRGTGEKIAAGAVPYIVGGELVAPVKAAEGAGVVTRALTSVANQLPASLVGALSENNQGDLNAIAQATAFNAIAGSALEKVGGATVNKVRNMLPESLGGFTQAEKAATVANPEYVQSVLQGGNPEAQAAFRTGTTTATGESLLTPSQVFNTGEGAKFIRAEQRDLSRGTSSQYGQRLQAQKEGESLIQAAQNTLTPTGDVGLLQESAQGINKAFKERANQLYNENKEAAQNVLNSVPVKITELKMPETRTLATEHLEANKATGNIQLTPATRRTLTQFNKAEIKTVDDIDLWKRKLNEERGKAIRSGDYTSADALKQTVDSLRNEADKVITTINPQAGSLYRDADKFYSQSVGEFGDKSVIGKIAGKENPDLAANALIRGQNAEFNTQQIVNAMRDAVNRGDIATAQQLSQQLGQGLGEATRGEALRAATTGENFSATRFANTLARLEPQAQAANDLAALGGAVSDQAALNQALADVIRTQRNRAEVAAPSTLVSQIAGRATGGGIGSLIGGTPGAVIGQQVGGKVTEAVSQGLLDRLAGTVKRGNEYIDYLSNPENAQKVADVLAARGATLNDATAQEVKGIIDNIRRGVTSSTIMGQPVEQTTPATPATQASAPVTAPVTAPEPQPQPAQAAKIPDRFAGVSPQAINLYKAISGAETGGLENRFIRTKAAESGVSTAYGPAQITGTLASDFRKNHANIFTKAELKYLDRFIAQANKMKKAPSNDPVYGYGGVGELSSPEDQRLYAQVAVKMLDDKFKSNKSLDKTVTQWRGNDNDKAYFEKVKANYRAAKSNQVSYPVKSWSRGS
ncbi:hypothetical protein DFV88_24805 [Salmonella enterica subsp. enterica serovar Newport]|nr:hypothetical protein [Salmonella enterica subsp. enterica serovar Newport]